MRSAAAQGSTGKQLRSRRGIALAGALLLGASWATTGQAQAQDGPHRRPDATFSYCGLGHGPADSHMAPGGGGDTLVIDDPEGIYHYVHDSASPVSLASHDRVIFMGIRPSELRLLRHGDSLVICHDVRRYELVLDGHYCRHGKLAPNDVPNSEIEEIAFLATGEIWLADVLAEEAAKTPGAFPPPGDDSYSGGERWRIRPFRDVLPDAAKPATTCR